MKIWLDQVRDEPFNWDENAEHPSGDPGRPRASGSRSGPVRGQVVYADPGFSRARLSYEQTLSCNRVCSRSSSRPRRRQLMILVDRNPEAEKRARAARAGPGQLTIRKRSSRRSHPDRAAPAERADEAALPRRLQGLCPECGAELNAGPARAGDEDGSPLGDPRRAEEPARDEVNRLKTCRPRRGSTTMPNPNDAIPRPAATSAALTTRWRAPPPRPCPNCGESSCRTARAQCGSTAAGR